MTFSFVDSSDSSPLNIDIEMGESSESDSDEMELNSVSVPVSVSDGLVDCSPGGIEGDDEDPKRGWSIAWDHFKEATLPNGKKKNKCLHCNKLLSVQPGKTTSHLIRHLRLACPHRAKLFPKKPEDTSKSALQTQLHGVVLSVGKSSVHTFTINFEKVKTLAAHMILAHEYPFNIVEHKVFNDFFRAYTLYYKKISRYIVRKECFAVYDKEKERLINILSKVNRVSLTTDCWWSEVQRIGYMIASVTVDNVSANDVCIAILKKDHNLLSNLILDGKLFHVRCCAHIINLLVRDGLKEIEKIIDVVREGVKYLFGSENRLTSFNEHRINLKLPPNKLVLDNNTRWNSTFVMLNTTYTYRQCFTKYGEDDDAFERYCPSETEWAEVVEVCEFLEVFLDVTNVISGSNYPTVNLFLMELCRVKALINAQLHLDSKKHMHNMAIRMTLKYDKYWDECDLLLSFGSILDPRYKKGMIRFAYMTMYPSDYNNKMEMVWKRFYDLFEQYATIYGDTKGKGPESL
ncbi:hypothetical protein LIER_19940 [Lithospermum erythrorhizon]|uniref:BED-type domain-containing protein n=1 Tax=Lithospermum erythrorhizon TaxID=34254 RepID=A0AAV3QM66_LITER